MTQTYKTTARLLGALAVASTLVACDPDNSVLGGGSQASTPAPGPEPVTAGITPDV